MGLGGWGFSPTIFLMVSGLKVEKSGYLDSAPDPREYPFFLLMGVLSFIGKKDTA